MPPFFSSSTNAKKWEVELQTLKANNQRLTTALQESTANVEEWKKQLAAYKEENSRLKKRVKRKPFFFIPVTNIVKSKLHFVYKSETNAFAIFKKKNDTHDRISILLVPCI